LAKDSYMNDKPEKTETDEEEEILRTFDMYHFFSRKDVILIIFLVLLLLVYIVFQTVFAPQTA